MKKIFFIIFSFVLSISLLHAQNSKTAMSNLMQQIFMAEQFTMELRVRLYPSKEDTEAVYDANILAQKDGKKFFYQLPEVIYLYGNEYSVMVDKANEQMYVRSINAQADKNLPFTKEMMIAGIDTMIQHCDSMAFSLSKNGNEIHRFYVNNGEVIYTEIEINPKTTQPQAIRYLFQEGYTDVRYEVVDFVVLNLHPQFAAGTFSEKKWIKNNGGIWQGAGTYQFYHIQVIEDEE